MQTSPRDLTPDCFFGSGEFNPATLKAGSILNFLSHSRVKEQVFL